MSTHYNPFTASVQDNVMCIALSSNPMPAEKFAKFVADVYGGGAAHEVVRSTKTVLTRGVTAGWLTVDCNGKYKAAERIHKAAFGKGFVRYTFEHSGAIHGEERVLHHITTEPGLTRKELHIRMCSDALPRVLVASTSSFITHNIRQGLAFEKDGRIYPADLASLLPKSMLAEESDDASIDASDMVADLKAAARAEQDAMDKERLWALYQRHKAKLEPALLQLRAAHDAQQEIADLKAKAIRTWHEFDELCDKLRARDPDYNIVELMPPRDKELQS